MTYGVKKRSKVAPLCVFPPLALPWMLSWVDHRSSRKSWLHGQIALKASPKYIN